MLIPFLKNISNLFNYQIIPSVDKVNYVLLKENKLNYIDYHIPDKTAFEAFYNHVHIIDKVKKRDFKKLTLYLPSVGEMLLKCLEHDFPDKKFVVFVTVHLHDSATIRFHQIFEGESVYYDTNAFSGNKREKVFEFRSK